MTRIPPNLIYLTIYNPSLRPSTEAAHDDEDAEEQAHILFYTSKERAVSRDRMLRQVGLAKALVNFSEMFNSDDPCNNVHSQRRRLVMVSPEPDFWIHAGVEVAKVPRVPIDKGKGKGKDKPKLTEKGEKREPSLAYDYQDGSVHDVALRADILRGYDRFKLLYGSFTSILTTLGQQALELQLERFFTVWAWSWNLETGPDFGEHLGVPLHPLFRSLVPFLDTLSSELPDETVAILLSPPYVVLSTRYSNAGHPSSLPRHLLSLVPLHKRTPPGDPITELPITSEGPINVTDPRKDITGVPDANPNTHPGAPAEGMVMDVRKWNWPGYLTFGRGPAKKPNEHLKTEEKPALIPSEGKAQSTSVHTSPVDVDRSALDDAISTNNSPTSYPLASSVGSRVTSDPHTVSWPDGGESPLRPPSPDEDAGMTLVETNRAPTLLSSSEVHSDPPPAKALPEFLTTSVYLAEPDDALLTRRRRIYYHIKDQVMLALLGMDSDNAEAEPLGLQTAAEKVDPFFDDIKNCIDNDTLRSSTDTLPSATKILQPTDRHIISTKQFTVSSAGFTSRSAHLYNAQELQAMDLDISEVFSRGQNPQHWHVARRGIGLGKDGIANDGEVYMEVFRKETSLTDVDNVLAGVVRRSELTDVE